MTAVCTARAISSSTAATASDAVNSRSLVLRGPAVGSVTRSHSALNRAKSSVVRQGFSQTFCTDSPQAVCSLVCRGPSEAATDRTASSR